jgi:hypothetical protein
MEGEVTVVDISAPRLLSPLIPAHGCDCDDMDCSWGARVVEILRRRCFEEECCWRVWLN